jgi:CYTH domain-containing protein
VPDGPVVWEIDAFLDRPLVLAEIELPTPDFPVEIPDWLAPFLVREVTDESAFSNLRLACEPGSA